jgi:hypothetical protein
VRGRPGAKERVGRADGIGCRHGSGRLRGWTGPFLAASSVHRKDRCPLGTGRQMPLEKGQ